MQCPWDFAWTQGALDLAPEVKLASHSRVGTEGQLGIAGAGAKAGM